MMTPAISQPSSSSKVSQTNQTENSLRLPENVLVQIYEILDKTDRISLAHVNQQWRQVACPLIQTLVLGEGEHQLDHCAERFPSLTKVVYLAPTLSQLISLRGSQLPSKTLIQVCPEWQFELKELQSVQSNDLPSTQQSLTKSASSPIAALLAILHFGRSLAFAGEWRAHRGLALVAIRTNFRDLTSISPELRDDRDLVLMGLRGHINLLRNSRSVNVNSENALRSLENSERKITNYHSVDCNSEVSGVEMEIKQKLQISDMFEYKMEMNKAFQILEMSDEILTAVSESIMKLQPLLVSNN